MVIKRGKSRRKEIGGYLRRVVDTVDLNYFSTPLSISFTSRAATFTRKRIATFRLPIAIINDN